MDQSRREFAAALATAAGGGTVVLLLIAAAVFLAFRKSSKVKADPGYAPSSPAPKAGAATGPADAAEDGGMPLDTP